MIDFKDNPCEQHLDVQTGPFCPICLMDECDRYREALARLVALKDGPRDEVYEREKPLAWQAARDAISRNQQTEDR